VRGVTDAFSGAQADESGVRAMRKPEPGSGVTLRTLISSPQSAQVILLGQPADAWML
jgi:hypothetical protein